ncbi:hypothetical protein B9Z55_012448 [Caenorhabditis nigoni]|nr:hypothetical protein B9Z55_012448 [Caenorhabditis nigoni]
MILVYGAPQSTDDCDNFDGTWNECVQYCYSTESCVFVTTLDDISCRACLYKTVITKIARQEEGQKVGIKITLDEIWNDNCPRNSQTLNAPTFEANPVVVDFSKLGSRKIYQNSVN